MFCTKSLPYAWGAQDGSKLGNALTNFVAVSNPIKVPFANGVNIADIATEYGGVYALDANGSGLFAWGNYYDGSNTVSSPTSLKSKLPQGANFTSIVGGEKTLYLLKQNGTVWSFGEGSDGQCGDGSTQDCRNSATQVALPNDTNITKIASNYNSQIALALDINGKVYGWGKQGYEELANGEKESVEATPIELNISTATGWYYDANITDIDVGLTILRFKMIEAMF